MTKAYIGYTDKRGMIKSVLVEKFGEIDSLGIELNEYFKDLADVKDLIINSIFYIEDGEVYYTEEIEYLREEDLDFFIYENFVDFYDDIETDYYYYLFEDNTWKVLKPQFTEFKDLDIVIEEEY